MTVWIGIDNGLSGAIAFIDTGDIHRGQSKVIDMPIIGKEYDVPRIIREISCIISEPKTEVKACVEYAQGMPGQGSVSIFKIGKNYGITQGILATLSIAYEIVKPQKWQNEFGITSDIKPIKLTKDMTENQKKDIKEQNKVLKAERKKEIKQRSVQVAQRLFPLINFTTPRGAIKDGWSDAILMAEYIRRVNESRTQKSNILDK